MIDIFYAEIYQLFLGRHVTRAGGAPFRGSPL